MDILGRIKNALSPKQEAQVTGAITVAFGCEGCPNRKKVTAPSIGALSIEGSITVPWAVTLDVDCKITNGTHIRLSDISILGVNQEVCELPCPNRDTIEDYYDSFGSEASVLDMQFSPPTIIHDEEGRSRMERPE